CLPLTPSCAIATTSTISLVLSALPTSHRPGGSLASPPPARHPGFGKMRWTEHSSPAPAIPGLRLLSALLPPDAPEAICPDRGRGNRGAHTDLPRTGRAGRESS